MEEIKMNEEYTMYKAPEGKIFIHKEQGVKLFGEAVVVHVDQTENTIDEFELVTKKKFNKLMEETKEESE